MEPLLDLANHAAAQNDRWLFVGSLIVLGCFAVATMRYFVRQHERLIADHKLAREDYQASLRRIVTEQNEANARLMLCLDNNSRVLEECRDELRFCREERHIKFSVNSGQ